MNLNLNEFAREVHANAVAHGFWREGIEPEVHIALIHSEWSEAIKEHRHGMPMLYYPCMKRDGKPCNNCGKKTPKAYGAQPKPCLSRGTKPEGVAVELIDGCIRILDYMAGTELRFMTWGDKHEVIDMLNREYADHSLPQIVFRLHHLTVQVDNLAASLSYAIHLVFAYLRAHNLDPEALMLEKHEYNKGRPVLHGKNKY